MSLKCAIHEGSRESFDAIIDRQGWVYQSHAFGEVLRRGMGQKILRIVATDGDEPRGAVSLAVLQSPFFGKLGVSLPVSDHSGICAVDAQAADAIGKQLMDILRDRRLDSIELRHLGDSFPGLELPCSRHKITMRLELPSTPEELWDSLKAKVRNLVRKGEKASLEYRQGGLELLDAFYPVYARNLRDLGTPCYPRTLFSAWMELFPDQTRIHLAQMPGRGKVIAVGFTFSHRGVMQIPFAASLREYRTLSPNMFLYWKMLEDAIGTGHGIFDFGRSTREGGTYRFKKQWGAVEIPLSWHYCLKSGGDLPDLRADSPRFRLAVSLWQKMPVGLATWLGNRLVRHLP